MQDHSVQVVAVKRGRQEVAEEGQNHNGHGGGEEGPEQTEQDNFSLGCVHHIFAPYGDDKVVGTQCRELDEKADEKTEEETARFDAGMLLRFLFFLLACSVRLFQKGSFHSGAVVVSLRGNHGCS